MNLATPELVRRRRRVWPWVVLGVVVLLGAGAVAADFLVRGWAEGLVAARIAEALEVPDEDAVEVQLGAGSVLLQALAGSVDQVDIRVDDLALGPLTGDLAVAAQGVPLDPASPTRALAIDYRIASAGLSGIADQLSGVPIDEVSIEGSELLASGSISLLGQSFPLGIGLTPAAVDGALGFAPTSVRIGERTVTAAELAADPLWGGIAGPILQQRTVCIADQLPAVFLLTRAEIAQGELHLGLAAAGVALGGPELTVKGDCPA
ncbi:LmeA family phospholipid-binding protein [Protaetiibacter larvae]|uniref:DUF2993 domain-containing protein n=1 Tax=Protaetiibacter larvae TaxID=2592654 RepID=A0A5C1Y8F3_9MICO|nr:DUF2993 domain-containing protein [Protaetiibacter larvae]QEO10383.1 DUF2993 domain-containing protein [Protaetiibacter larvae]